jgi:hypothetical protein
MYTTSSPNETQTYDKLVEFCNFAMRTVTFNEMHNKDFLHIRLLTSAIEENAKVIRDRKEWTPLAQKCLFSLNELVFAVDLHMDAYKYGKSVALLSNQPTVPGVKYMSILYQILSRDLAIASYNKLAPESNVYIPILTAYSQEWNCIVKNICKNIKKINRKSLIKVPSLSTIHEHISN